MVGNSTNIAHFNGKYNNKFLLKNLYCNFFIYSLLYNIYVRSNCETDHFIYIPTPKEFGRFQMSIAYQINNCCASIFENLSHVFNSSMSQTTVIAHFFDNDVHFHYGELQFSYAAHDSHIKCCYHLFTKYNMVAVYSISDISHWQLAEEKYYKMIISLDELGYIFSLFKLYNIIPPYLKLII